MASGGATLAINQTFTIGRLFTLSAGSIVASTTTFAVKGLSISTQSGGAFGIANGTLSLGYILRLTGGSTVLDNTVVPKNVTIDHDTGVEWQSEIDIAGGTLNASGTIDANLSVQSGVLNVTGPLIASAMSGFATGQVRIGHGASLDISQAPPNPESFTFADATGILRANAAYQGVFASNVTGPINNFQPGDILDLTGATVKSASYSPGLLTVEFAAGRGYASETFQVASSYTGTTTAIKSDGQGGWDITLGAFAPLAGPLGAKLAHTHMSPRSAAPTAAAHGALARADIDATIAKTAPRFLASNVDAPRPVAASFASWSVDRVAATDTIGGANGSAAGLVDATAAGTPRTHGGILSSATTTTTLDGLLGVTNHHGGAALMFG